jgi:hypothetical protein
LIFRKEVKVFEKKEKRMVRHNQHQMCLNKFSLEITFC